MIAKLVYNSNNYGLWMFMVPITIVSGAYKPTNITGGSTKKEALVVETEPNEPAEEPSPCRSVFRRREAKLGSNKKLNDGEFCHGDMI